MRRALILVPEAEGYFAYRQRAVQHSAALGEAPIAYHVDPKTETAILANIAGVYEWTGYADVVAVYVDLGITDHMVAVGKFARQLGVPVERRTLEADSWVKELLALIREKPVA